MKSPTTSASDDLTARDLLSVLRAAAHGADASDLLGGKSVRWEEVVATLVVVLLKRGVVTDQEIVEAFRNV